VDVVADPICKTRRKIQATKQWLNRADEHFDQNAAVRGQMDLLLAEAELRSTREAIQQHPNKLRAEFFQQVVAFGLAAILAVAALSGAWWWWRDAVVAETMPQPQTVAPAPSTPVIADPVPIKSAMASKTEEIKTVAIVEAKNSDQEVNSTHRSTYNDTAISPDEMKRLVQAAGHSLRGRTKQ
jgi:hypothetical protein